MGTRWRATGVLLATFLLLAVFAPSALPHAYHPGASTPVTRAPGLRLDRIGTFRYPTYFTADRGDASREYIVEQEGRIRVRHNNRILARPFLDIADLVRYSDSESERGLLSMAFAPDYQRSGRFFVFYTENDGDLRLDELRRSSSDPHRAKRSTRRHIFTLDHSTYPNHHGGQLQFGPDGYLYVSTGDGGGDGRTADPLRTAQNLRSLLGKVLRVDPRRPTSTRGYSVPAGNPFLGPDGRRDEIWAYGLRNPWRFSFDRHGSALWLADVGMKSREEINFSSGGVRGKGFNFGWSCFEGTLRRSGCTASGHDRPLLQYTHDGDSCSVTGGYVLRDPRLAGLSGRYIYGDYCTGALHAARRTVSGVENRYLGLVVPRLSSFGEDAEGHLYAASRSGAVYRLRAAP